MPIFAGMLPLNGNISLMRYFIPLIIFVGLLGFFWKSLQHDPHQLPSALINKPVPEFNYPSLTHTGKNFSKEKFLGHVSLLNIWATWCISCRAEHPVLMDIARSKRVVVYGLNYKDDPLPAKQWLEKYGNPYQDVILDNKGTLAIEFGTYGTPETFVIDAKGIIRYRYIGPISPDVWKDKIAPEVSKW
jgi:cytochrome c biogenesis protein CcmG/thiol:disulfide interchange protein DsbE